MLQRTAPGGHFWEGGREGGRAAEYALHSGRPAGSGQRGLGGGPPPWSVEEGKAEAMLQRKGGLLGGLLIEAGLRQARSGSGSSRLLPRACRGSSG